MVTGAAAALTLAACSAQDSASGAQTAQTTANVEDADCIPIADGTYQVRDGKVLVMKANASRPEAVPTTDVPGQPLGWAAMLEQSFASSGYDWMGLQVRDGVAAVTGIAPGLAARDVSFLSAKAAILNDAEGAEKVDLIVNTMAVDGREETLGGQGLARLMNGAVTASACQDAFDQTLSVDDIDFPVNTATLTAAELPVADALTGIARLCSAYKIEIGEHTDTRGSDSYNLQLSRQRADAIRDYMIERGVSEDVLKAVGYGEAQPIDTGNSAEARARNERTEVKVSTR
jgi:outer membrane protein OmpA-like peptidoglycan-associated protein